MNNNVVNDYWNMLCFNPRAGYLGPPQTRKFTLSFPKNSLEGVVFCLKMALGRHFPSAFLIITSGHLFHCYIVDGGCWYGGTLTKKLAYYWIVRGGYLNHVHRHLQAFWWLFQVFTVPSTYIPLKNKNQTWQTFDKKCKKPLFNLP